MKRIVIHRAGGYERLKLEEGASPEPRENELVVETDAIGVNYADCIVRMGLYETAKKYVGWPITPGFEFSGRVLKAGSRAGDLAPGTRVLGISRFGAYASELAVPRHQLFKLPETMSPLEGGAFPVIFFTAYFPLFALTRVRPGEKILVHSAAGGVGSALVQLGKIAGAEVTAVVGAPHKIQAARELGADHVIDKSSEDLWARALAIAPRGYDVVLDANGVSTLGQSYEHLARGGRIVVYGFSSMIPKDRGRPRYGKLAFDYLRTPRFNPLKMTTENRSVLAFNLSDLFEKEDIIREGMEQLLAWQREGKIRLPKITSFGLAEAAEAHRAIESGRTVGKLVLMPRKES